MVQIYERPPGFAEQLGAGLGAGLQALAQQKMQQMQSRQGLQALGFPREKAASIATMPPDVQREIVKQQLQAPQQQAFASALSQILRNESEPEQFPMAGLTQDQAFKLAQLQQAKIKEQKGEEKFLIKQNQKAFTEANDEAKKAEINTARFGRLEKLIKSGKIPSGAKALLFIGEAGQLRKPFAWAAPKELVEFQKIITEMTRGARDSYGARITNFELETFLNQLPSLLTTPEGQLAVVRDLKIINDLNKIYSKGIKESFKEGGGIGKISYDEATQNFEEKYRPEIDRLISEYIEPTSITPAETPETASLTKAPPNSIKVQSPDGKIGYIPKQNINKALKAGFKKL